MYDVRVSRSNLICCCNSSHDYAEGVGKSRSEWRGYMITTKQFEIGESEHDKKEMEAENTSVSLGTKIPILSTTRLGRR